MHKIKIKVPQISVEYMNLSDKNDAKAIAVLIEHKLSEPNFVTKLSSLINEAYKEVLKS